MTTSPETHPALRRRAQEQARLLEVARRYARRLADLVPIRWVVVAGSVARGDFHDGSDIDVLVLSDALPRHPLRRAELLFAAVEGGIEPKGLTLEEVDRELKRGNPLVVEALSRGVVVYPEGLGLPDLRRQLTRSRRAAPLSRQRGAGSVAVDR